MKSFNSYEFPMWWTLSLQIDEEKEFNAGNLTKMVKLVNGGAGFKFLGF